MTLRVTAKSTDGGSLSYQWYKAADEFSVGVVISGATATSWIVTADSEAYYYVVVVNTKDGKTTQAVSTRTHVVITDNPDEVVFPKKPVVLAAPVGGTIKNGSSHSLSVIAKSMDDGSLSYQWYRAEDEIADGVAISGATAAVYALNVADAATEAYYYVVVTNSLNGQIASVKSAVVKIEYERITVVVDAGDGVFCSGASETVLSVIPGSMTLGDILSQIGLPSITKDGETRYADCFLDEESANDPYFNDWNFDYAELLWSSIKKNSTFVARYNEIINYHIEFYNKDAEDTQNVWSLMNRQLEKDDDGYSVVFSVYERGQKFRITSKWCTFFYGDGTASAVMKTGVLGLLKPVLHSGNDAVGGTIDAAPGFYRLCISVQPDGSFKTELKAVQNELYTGDFVYIIGGIIESTLEPSGTAEIVDAANLGKVWKIPVTNGAFSFEFTYNGSDTWGSSYGCHSFLIFSNIDNSWMPDFRWGACVVSAGNEGTIYTESYSTNIIFQKLVIGAKYVVSGTVRSLDGTISLSSNGELPPTMDLVMHEEEPVVMTQVSISEFEYDIPVSSSAKSVQFCINYGDKWYGGLHWLTVGNKVELSAASSKPSSDMRFDCEAAGNYTVCVTYDKETEKITVVVTGGLFIDTAAVCGGFTGWSPWTFTKIDSQTGYVDFVAAGTEEWSYQFVIQEIAGVWDPGYNSASPIVAVGKNESPIPVQLKYRMNGDINNAKVTGCVEGTCYRMTLTVVDAVAHKITVAVQECVPDSLYKADGISYICSNYGTYKIAWSSKKSDGSYEGTVTIPAQTQDMWYGEDSDIEFGVTADTGWSNNYNGAVLETAGVPVYLKKDGDSNNKIIGVNPSVKDVVITLISTENSIAEKYN